MKNVKASVMIHSKRFRSVSVLWSSVRGDPIVIDDITLFYRGKLSFGYRRARIHNERFVAQKKITLVTDEAVASLVL